MHSGQTDVVSVSKDLCAAAKTKERGRISKIAAVTEAA